MEETEENLAHYGIPGMKWGKRKARSSSEDSDGSGSEKPKAPRKKMTQQQKLAVVGGAYAALVVARNAPLILNTAKLVGMNAAKKHAGARFAANLLADKRGIAAYSTIRLAADAAGNWG